MQSHGSPLTTGFIHYSAPPVVGGVESVIYAHSRVFLQAEYPVNVIAGRGKGGSLPKGTDFTLIPELDSQRSDLSSTNAALESGSVPPNFEQQVERIYLQLEPVVRGLGSLINHNVFTKHFNLPLTAALHRLIDDGLIANPIAWCHDFTWTSPNSRSKVHPGYPWDLLRTYRSDTTYVTVSVERQKTLAALFGCDQDKIKVIYNGVDPVSLLGLSLTGADLIDQLDLLAADPVILMPVRVTQAKNIEFAMQVVAELKKQGFEPRLILTGPPDPHDSKSRGYYQSLLDLRKRLGVEKEMCFAYESRFDPNQPYLLEASVVGDLFRVCDLVFMPSHREGFGMPVLEAGLAGVPIAAAQIPAALEIASEEALIFDPEDTPAQVGKQILRFLESSPTSRLRRRIRRDYTWEAIFRRDIEPLLTQRHASR